MANNFFYLLVIIFLVFVGVLIFAVTRKRDSQESSTSATPKKKELVERCYMGAYLRGLSGVQDLSPLMYGGMTENHFVLTRGKQEIGGDRDLLRRGKEVNEMKKLLVMLVTLGLIFIGTYFKAAAQESGGETKIEMEKKTEEKAPTPAEVKSEESGKGAEADVPKKTEEKAD